MLRCPVVAVRLAGLEAVLTTSSKGKEDRAGRGAGIAVEDIAACASMPGFGGVGDEGVGAGVLQR